MLKKFVQQGRRRVETGGVPSGAHGATNKERSSTGTPAFAAQLRMSTIERQHPEPRLPFPGQSTPTVSVV
ncbi:MAG TPA: hypothetical protein VLL06_11200, partial [Nitrospiraceae bacterium]|nr:hypothetical protein [Nitrospiraceae bacterium]